MRNDELFEEAPASWAAIRASETTARRSDMRKKRRRARKQSKTRSEALERRVEKLEKNTITNRLRDVFTGAALLSAFLTGKPASEYGEIIMENLRNRA